MEKPKIRRKKAKKKLKRIQKDKQTRNKQNILKTIFQALSKLS